MNTYETLLHGLLSIGLGKVPQFQQQLAVRESLRIQRNLAGLILAAQACQCMGTHEHPIHCASKSVVAKTQDLAMLASVTINTYITVEFFMGRAVTFE